MSNKDKLLKIFEKRWEEGGGDLPTEVVIETRKWSKETKEIEPSIQVVELTPQEFNVPEEVTLFVRRHIALRRPFMDAAEAAQLLGVARPSARAVLRELCDEGKLKEFRRVKGAPGCWWWNHGYFGRANNRLLQSLEVRSLWPSSEARLMYGYHRALEVGGFHKKLWEQVSHDIDVLVPQRQEVANRTGKSLEDELSRLCQAQIKVRVSSIPSWSQSRYSECQIIISLGQNDAERLVRALTRMGRR